LHDSVVTFKKTGPGGWFGLPFNGRAELHPAGLNSRLRRSYGEGIHLIPFGHSHALVAKIDVTLMLFLDLLSAAGACFCRQVPEKLHDADQHGASPP
jgi:hypothetical protein